VWMVSVMEIVVVVAVGLIIKFSNFCHDLGGDNQFFKKFCPDIFWEDTKILSYLGCIWGDAHFSLEKMGVLAKLIIHFFDWGGFGCCPSEMGGVRWAGGKNGGILRPKASDLAPPPPSGCF